MTRYHENIEPSKFRKGEYVGYGSGAVWYIRKSGSGWQAISQDDKHTCIFGDTLKSMAKRITFDR